MRPLTSTLVNTIDDLGTDISNFFSRPTLYVGLSVLGVMSVAIAWLIRRSGRGERGLCWLSLAVGSALYITAFTVFRDGLPTGFNVGTLVQLPRLDWNHFSYDPLSSSQFLLNMLLFVPYAAVLTVLTRRPSRVFRG
jgi:hypothetical protein